MQPSNLSNVPLQALLTARMYAFMMICYDTHAYMYACKPKLEVTYMPLQALLTGLRACMPSTSAKTIATTATTVQCTSIQFTSIPSKRLLSGQPSIDTVVTDFV